LQELIISLGTKSHGKEKINQQKRETEHFRHIQGAHHQITKHTKMNETPKKKNQTNRKKKHSPVPLCTHCIAFASAACSCGVRLVAGWLAAFVDAHLL
jgi:hypothetical protein